MIRRLHIAYKDSIPNRKIYQQTLRRRTSTVITRDLQIVLFALVEGNSLCFLLFPMRRASEISRGRGAAKFRYIREIPRN